MLSKRFAAVSETSDLDARLLVAHALEHDRAWLLAHGDESPSEEAALCTEALARRRERGEPLAYVLGETWFFGRRFMVSNAVLVPRPETEQLVEAALADVRSRFRAGRRLRVCDVGTGSGAIALTLAAELPQADVVASDISAAALEVARQNAELLGLSRRVTFVHGDLGEPLSAFAPFDCLVANLPYVASADVPTAPHPVAFEPPLAVDGGRDGLVLYRRLAAALSSLCVPGGSAFFEIAPDVAEALANVIVAELPQAHVEIGEDYAGLDRWIAVTLER